MEKELEFIRLWQQLLVQNVIPLMRQYITTFSSEAKSVARILGGNYLLDTDKNGWTVYRETSGQLYSSKEDDASKALRAIERLGYSGQLHYYPEGDLWVLKKWAHKRIDLGHDNSLLLQIDCGFFSGVSRFDLKALPKESSLKFIDMSIAHHFGVKRRKILVDIFKPSDYHNLIVLLRSVYLFEGVEYAKKIKKGGVNLNINDIHNLLGNPQFPRKLAGIIQNIFNRYKVI